MEKAELMCYECGSVGPGVVVRAGMWRCDACGTERRV